MDCLFHWDIFTRINSLILISFPDTLSPRYSTMQQREQPAEQQIQEQATSRGNRRRNAMYQHIFFNVLDTIYLGILWCRSRRRSIFLESFKLFRMSNIAYIAYNNFIN